MVGIQAFKQQHRNWGLIWVLGLLSLLRWDWHLQELGFLLWLLHWDWELVLGLGLQRILRLHRHVIRLLQDWAALLMLLEGFLTLLPVMPIQVLVLLPKASCHHTKNTILLQ